MALAVRYTHKIPETFDFFGMILKVFDVCYRMVTIATICASTNTNVARKVLYGLFWCPDGLMSQVV